MRIIVPIKQVPEASEVKMDAKTGTMIREGVEAIINPLDLYAIEAAIQLREAHCGEIIAISMGPPKAETALREAIAMGCDSGILLSDKAFAGSDTWATSYALSAAVRKIGDFNLIICGERATDGDTGQVGPGIASFLDLPVATYISKIISIGKNTCRAQRLIEEGYETLDIELPAVLTVVKEIASPRLPTLRGKQKAAQAAIPLWNAATLNIKPAAVGLEGSPTRVVKIFHPKIGRKCRMVAATDELSTQHAAAELVAFLSKKGLI